MDTQQIKFGHRLIAVMERSGKSAAALARELGVSRQTVHNWMDRKEPPPSKRLRDDLSDALGETADFLYAGFSLPASKNVHLKNGGLDALKVREAQAKYNPVASRLPQRREPSTRQDVTDYLLRLMEAADGSGNPDAWPVILARLRKQFPLDEWEEEQAP